MSELPKPSFNNPNLAPAASREDGGGSVTEQQIPHSGNLPERLREQPVQAFDNTTLPEAYEQQLLEVPNSPASLPEAQPAPEKKSKKGLIIGVSAGLAGAALVAGSIIGINAANSSNAGPEGPTSDPATPTEVEPEPQPLTPENYLPTREDIEIPAGLSDEDLAFAVIDRQNHWLNEGDDDETDLLRERKREANLSWDDFLPLAAQESADTYAPALFGDDWQSNSNVAPYVQRMREANLAVMDRYTATAWNSDEHPENIEGYRYTREVTGVTVVEAEGGHRTLEIIYNNVDNNSKNSIEPHLSPGGVLTVSTVVSGDVELITSIVGDQSS